MTKRAGERAPFANPKREAKPAAPERGGGGSNREEQKLQEQRAKDGSGCNRAPGGRGCQKPAGQPAKKKLTAVFRPQNAQQQISARRRRRQAANQGHTAPACPQRSRRRQQHRLHRQYRQRLPNRRCRPSPADTVSEKAAAPQPSATPQAGALARNPATARRVTSDTAREPGRLPGKP